MIGQLEEVRGGTTLPGPKHLRTSAYRTVPIIGKEVPCSRGAISNNASAKELFSIARNHSEPILQQADPAINDGSLCTPSSSPTSLESLGPRQQTQMEQPLIVRACIDSPTCHGNAPPCIRDGHHREETLSVAQSINGSLPNVAHNLSWGHKQLSPERLSIQDRLPSQDSWFMQNLSFALDLAPLQHDLPPKKLTEHTFCSVPKPALPQPVEPPFASRIPRARFPQALNHITDHRHPRTTIPIRRY